MADRPETQCAAPSPSPAISAETELRTADTPATDSAIIRRWDELREWRTIVFIVAPVALVAGLLTGGWAGWLIALGAPIGALTRLYVIRCPDCGARFTGGRLAPMPSACAACGSVAFDYAPRRSLRSETSASTRTVTPPSAEVLARRLARWNAVRKQLAVFEIAASAFGIVNLLGLVGEARGEAAIIIGTMLAVLTFTGFGGLLLWRDRPGGVPLSLCYCALQIVLFHVDVARLWVVLGPYALVIVGSEGATAAVGFTYGFANVEAVGRAPDWVGINLLALAAFWFLWRRPWREMPAAVTTHDPLPLVTTPRTDE